MDFFLSGYSGSLSSDNGGRNYENKKLTSVILVRLSSTVVTMN